MRIPNPITPAVRQGWQENISKPVERGCATVSHKANVIMDNCNYFNIRWFGGKYYEPGRPMASYPPEYFKKTDQLARETEMEKESSGSESSIDVEPGLEELYAEETSPGIEGIPQDDPAMNEGQADPRNFGIEADMGPSTTESSDAGMFMETDQRRQADSGLEAQSDLLTSDHAGSTPSNEISNLSVKIESRTRSSPASKERSCSNIANWKVSPMSPSKKMQARWAQIRHKGKKSRSPPPMQTGKLSAVNTFLFILGKMMGVAILPMIGCFEKLGVAIGILVTVGAMTVSGVATRCMWHFIMRHPRLRNIADVTAQLFQACFGWTMTGFAIGWAEYFLYNLLIMAVHVKFGSNAIHFLVGEKIPLGGWTSDGVVCLLLSLTCAVLYFLPRKVISVMGACSGILTVSFIVVFFSVLFTKGPIELTQEELSESDIQRQSIHWTFNTESNLWEKMTSVLRIQFATLIASSVPMLMGDMKQPQDFPKAVVGHKIILTSILVVFGTVPCRVLAPQHTVLEPWRMIPQTWGKVAAALMLVPGVLQGMIYGVVNAQPLLNKIGDGERAGLTVRNLLLVGLVWVLACMITQAVPGLSPLMCIIGGVFGCAFGALNPALVELAMVVIEVKNTGASYLKRPQGIRKMFVVVFLLLAAGFFAFASKFAVEEFAAFVEDTSFIPFRPMPKQATPSVIGHEATAFPSATAEETATGTVYVSEETDADYYG